MCISIGPTATKAHSTVGVIGAGGASLAVFRISPAAITAPGLRKTGRPELNGNTLFQPGSSGTKGSAGKTAGGPIVGPPTRPSGEWKQIHTTWCPRSETNADRSNYGFGMIAGEPRVYGQCDFEVDFKARLVEPRPEVRGQIARIYFYMHNRYGLRMSRQDQQLYMAWDRQHPVSAWERERDRRIARIAGNNNPFVTGEQSWSLGHRPSGSGLTGTPSRKVQHKVQEPGGDLAIRGNRNSKIYHLPSGCPSYERISAHNIVPFGSEAAAVRAGFRKAGNCR